MRFLLLMASLIFTSQASFAAIGSVRQLVSVYTLVQSTPGMAVYFTLDTASTTFILDDSGNGRNGDLIGSPPPVVGVSSSAFLFDSINDDISFVPQDISGTTPLLFEAFIKDATNPSVRSAILWQTNPNTGQSLYTYFDGTSQKASAILIDGASEIKLSSGPMLNDGKFHYVAFAKRGGAGNQFELYVDGEMVANGNMGSNFGISGNDAAGVGGIGAQGGAVSFAGIIDEVGMMTGSNVPSVSEIKKRGLRFFGSQKAVRNTVSVRTLDALR